MEPQKQENQETAGLAQVESVKQEVEKVDRRQALEEKTWKEVPRRVKREQEVPKRREQGTAKEREKSQAWERKSERVPRRREERE